MQTNPPVFQNPQADGGSFFWEGKNDQKTVVLLFHGFTATTVEIRGIAEFFHEKGYSVAGPLLPGHGVSPEELNQVRFKDWIDCAEKSYLDIRKKYSHVFIAGESMGGLLTLWLASRYPEIKGVMVFAPALRIPRLWQANLVWPFVKYVYKNNIDLSSPWQGFNVVPMHAAAQLNQFQNRVKKALPLIQIPTLIFQGKLDKTIDPFSAVIALENISAEEKDLVWLEESTHCIVMDKQLGIVEKMCLDFIISHS